MNTIKTPHSSPTTSIVLYGRAIVFYIGMALATLLIAPLVIICIPLGFQRLYAMTKWWTGFNIWWLKVSCKVSYQIQGKENIPDHAVVVLSKHQSTWETLFLHWYLPPLAWVLKRELLWLPFFGWALATLQPIAINRKSSSEAMRQLYEQGKNYLEKGRWVLIFPEGTRTAPGQRRAYKLGGSRLATHSGYPVLPIAHNAGEFWRRRGMIKYPGTIQVVIGPLVESKNRSTQDVNKDVEAWIEETVTRISTVKNPESSTE
jgi:1-acyl-sn-glycerol-3-phosphate acyltransferase